MKITNHGVTNPLLTPQQPVEATAAAASGDAPASGVAADVNGYTPSAELLHLLHLVRQQPEIREERIQAAQERLQQGYYYTQASAEQTATAMINGVD